MFINMAGVMESKSLRLFALSLTLLNFCFAISTAQCPADKDKDWSYDDKSPNGPTNWGKKYPNCNGKHQSPINIETKQATKSGKRQKLSVEGYDQPIGKVMISNNGHMITVTPQDGKERSVKVEGKSYMLKHFHFHWGSKTNKKGSEDEINGNKYSMEVHLVHHDSAGKTVVVAGFLEEGNAMNPALDNILFVKPYYEYEGEHFEGEIQNRGQGKIDLGDLVDDRCVYYTYSGSIGFPPCTEPVTWLICRTNKGVKENQLNELYGLYSVKKGSSDAEKCHLINIFRPVQPLNDRKVYTQ